MAAAEPTRVAFVGLQSTGKTTYLAAFFAACETGHDNMAITKYGAGNREYLNSLADQLARCKPVERTKQSDLGEFRLFVKLSTEAPEQQLIIPDLSGELLRDSMNDRVLNPRLDSLLEEADAFLVFVRTKPIVRATQIADLNAALRAAGEEPGNSVAAERPEDWSVEQAATQARLTDVMQELMQLRQLDGVRVGITISAWDLRKDKEETPDSWANRELTLLLQLLNNSSVDTAVFGVSAQGGDYNDENDVVRLQQIDLNARPVVQLGDGQSAEIGAPLKWALRV